MPGNDLAPASGTIIFTEWRPPPLQAGDYELTVEQTLSNKTAPANGDKAPNYVNETHTTTRRFVVRGERFSLDPTELLAVFPPANNNGEYDNVLPHAVFYRRTLPWERSPEQSDDHASWLAILLFEADEAPPIQNAQVGDLMRGRFASSATDATVMRDSTLGVTTACYGEGFTVLAKKKALPSLTFELEQGENLYDPCQVIDVPVDLFAKVAPALADQKWLAHVRAVSSEKKAGGAPGDTQENSVVVGNRLPKPNSRCIAHIVSIEGLSEFLPDETGNAKTIQVNGQAATAIRLVSLASWSFASVDPKETFEQYLERLDLKAFQRTYKQKGTSAPEQAVANAFRLGYTALKHQTRLGDQTVSWMRGPLLPLENIDETIVVPPATDGSGVLSAADQAMRFNPKIGMSDVTYAAAWQLGRLLGLQSRVFSVGLYNWKRAAGHKTSQAVEHSNLMLRFSAVLGPAKAPSRISPAAMAKAPMANASLAAALVGLLASGVTKRKGPAGVSTRSAQPAATALTPRVNHYLQISAVIADQPTLKDIHDDTPVPPDVTAWLQNLVKLKGVPFGYLVPDEDMLPMESLRLFRLDGNWINALIEGACSIGRSSSAELKLDAVLVDKLYEATKAPKLVTGFLLRSAVVDGWPGLEVSPYGSDGKPLTSVVRMEKLAPNLLLYMVEGEIAAMEIHEPAEGLHFGVDLGSNQKDMRYITGPKPGTQITGAFATVAYRDPKATADDARVLRIADFAKSAQVAVDNSNGNTQDGKARKFTSAEFAVELVEGVQSVRFERSAK